MAYKIHIRDCDSDRIVKIIDCGSRSFLDVCHFETEIHTNMGEYEDEFNMTLYTEKVGFEGEFQQKMDF